MTSHQILAADAWRTIRRHARRARQRKAAVAYVTQDLIGLSKGDVLVVNASSAAVMCGETDARLLQRLSKRKVQLYHCADLHAKVLLLDRVAVIGSANMSTASRSRLIEAALLTSQATVV